MKPLASLAAFAVLTLAGGAAWAQSPPCGARDNVVLADLGLHVINAGFQRRVGCHLSLQASAGLYGPWTVNNNVAGLAGADHDPPGDAIGVGLRLRPFFYPMGRAPAGLWVSPFVQGALLSATRGGQSLTGVGVAAGLSVGWAWLFGERWLLALGLGGQYHTASFAGSAAFPGFARFAPTVDINVGYAF